MKRRLIFNHLAVLLVFFIFTYTFVLRTVYDMVCRNLISVSEQTISAMSSELSSVLEYGNAYILQLSINPQIQEALRSRVDSSVEDYSQVTEEAAQAMEEDDFLRTYMYANSVTLGNIPFMVEITYRTDDGYYIPVYYSNRQNQSGAELYTRQDPWIQALEERNGRFLWDSYSDASNTYLRLSKVIFDEADYSRIIGTISLDFSYDHLSMYVLNRLALSGISSAIVNRNTGEMIGYRTVSLPDIPGILDSDSQQMIDRNSSCLFVRRLDSTDFCLVGVKSLEEARQIYLKSCFILFAAAIAALMLGIALAFILGRNISNPIIRLSHTMKQVQDGNLDLSVSTKQKGEIGMLYDSFNYMIQMINRLIQENYVSLLNQKQSELNALQSQINTHFLYNTLDSINWLAMDYHASNISWLVTNLSTLLRTSLNNGNPELTLEQELTHVRSYLNIQQVRFPDLFQVHEEIEPETLQDKVIKMLLQPLAENAILHSFCLPDSEPSENILTIRARYDDDHLVLEVSNPAFPEDLDTIYQLLSESEQLPTKYGLVSIRQRLEIAYNHQATYTYTMDACGILMAQIRIPRNYTALNRTSEPSSCSAI